MAAQPTSRPRAAEPLRACPQVATRALVTKRPAHGRRPRPGAQGTGGYYSKLAKFGLRASAPGDEDPWHAGAQSVLGLESTLCSVAEMLHFEVSVHPSPSPSSPPASPERGATQAVELRAVFQKSDSRLLSPEGLCQTMLQRVQQLVRRASVRVRRTVHK
jgi:hypothetical protein